MATRVLLVDDHELIRNGLRRSFERQDDFEVVGEAGTVREAVHQAQELTPDVVIMDVRLPDGSGIDATRELRALFPALGIVVLTMYAGDEPLFAALEAGASAFIPKDAPANDVIDAARFSAADLADALKRRLNPSGPRLSPREKDVLALLAEGLAISAISKRLFISESTTKTHISKLYEKLGAANRAQALMTALRLGLLASPSPG
jgi:DNA-binding NarL/FixJ family response regulator